MVISGQKIIISYMIFIVWIRKFRLCKGDICIRNKEMTQLPFNTTNNMSTKIIKVIQIVNVIYHHVSHPNKKPK